MKLTTKQRHGLDTTQFALPGRRYPIEDKSHARNALARAVQHASPAEQTTIKRKVRSRFPDIAVGGKPKKFADGGKVEPVMKTVPKLKSKHEPSVGRLPRQEGSAGEPTVDSVPIVVNPKPEPKGYARGGRVY